MVRNSRYDILFEPVQIGPVRTKNRFYQVPHCTGTSNLAGQAVAAMRGMKAEGGWGVVCTEWVTIDETTDVHPFPSFQLWSDDDIPKIAAIADSVHAHDSLFGVELAHMGIAAVNSYTRRPAIGPSSQLNPGFPHPIQTRRMDKGDIREIRQNHRAAALRAKAAGADIVYVYLGHNESLFTHFLYPRYNDRSDEYGGTLENRLRLTREVLTDVKEAIGDTCAVALRFAVEDLAQDATIKAGDEGREAVEMLAELPDLWDVNISDWSYDSSTSRFSEEGFQEEFVSFVKGVTSKPVVGVGRFTSPDTMVSQIKRGVLDLIGAARPSIADPFLPNKIREGREDEIRECIGCNICVSGEMMFSPIRCTQNPTMMEEWKRGWHPEKINAKKSDDQYLIIGSGPAGLECALQLGKRGYDVIIAEARSELGGRVVQEARLPGLSAWRRVADHRIHQLRQMPNVEIYLESDLSAEQVIEFGIPRAVVASGATWRRDGVGRSHYKPLDGIDSCKVLTLDDVMSGQRIEGSVVIYDDDGSYISSVLAEHLKSEGCGVSIVTPHWRFAPWTEMTLEQDRVIERMRKHEIQVRCSTECLRILPGEIALEDLINEKRESLGFDHLLMLTSRKPNDSLYHTLVAQLSGQDSSTSVHKIGDCDSPGLIANAVFAGHLFARGVDESVGDQQLNRHNSAWGPNA